MINLVRFYFRVGLGARAPYPYEYTNCERRTNRETKNTRFSAFAFVESWRLRALRFVCKYLRRRCRRRRRLAHSLKCRMFLHLCVFIRCCSGSSDPYKMRQKQEKTTLLVTMSATSTATTTTTTLTKFGNLIWIQMCAWKQVNSNWTWCRHKSGAEKSWKRNFYRRFFWIWKTERKTKEYVKKELFRPTMCAERCACTICSSNGFYFCSWLHSFPLFWP